MAEWTTIPDDVLEPGKPIRSVDTIALRDNPVAIAEGAAGAPRISPSSAAINWAASTNTAAERDWVLNRTAGASVGAVGTYAFLGRTVQTATAQGATVAGSALRYCSISHSDNTWSTQTGQVGALGSTTAPAGTWRCMGRSDAIGAMATVWLRIS